MFKKKFTQSRIWTHLLMPYLKFMLVFLGVLGLMWIISFLLEGIA